MTEPPNASPSSKPAESASSAPLPAAPVEGVWGVVVVMTFVNFSFVFLALAHGPLFVLPSIFIAEIVFGMYLRSTSPRASKSLLLAALVAAAILAALFGLLLSICSRTKF